VAELGDSERERNRGERARDRERDEQSVKRCGRGFGRRGRAEGIESVRVGDVGVGGSYL
jgi:hypothetical protein